MANVKKTAADEKTTPVFVTQRYKGWDMSRIFWGLLLVLFGGLLLLDNLGILQAHFGNLLSLWPLLIVAWGVSLLNITGTWWRIVSAILMVASLGLFAWVALGATPFSNANAQTQHQRIEKAASTVKTLDVSINAGAGKVRIASQDTDTPIEATLRSNFAKLDVTSQNESDIQKVNVSANGDHGWWGGSFRNDLEVQLTRRLPVSLTVETGASDVDADLSQLMLQRLDLNLGASNGVVTLGNLVDNIDVVLKAGASSVTLRVPKDSGVSIRLDNGVSSQNLSGLMDKGNGLYETDGFTTAAKKIIIQGSIGVTSFELERY